MALPLIAALLLTGCGQSGEQGPPVPNSPHVRPLPFRDDAFNVLPADFDSDGRLDFAVVSHASNKMQFLFQRSPRLFEAGAESILVGFHPGDLIPLVPEKSIYLQLAEGMGQLVVFQVGPEGQLTPLSSRPEAAPRHGIVFHWPGWGIGLVVAPYGKDYLVLYKDIDPAHISGAEAFVVHLSTVQPSLRSSERPVLADIDGDGVDEILFATVNTHEVGVISRPKAGEAPAAGGVAAFKSGLARQVIPADLNEDGHMDLVVPDTTLPFQLHLLLNDGRGGFDPAARVDLDVPTREGIFRFAAGRDRDGLLYLLGANTDNLVLYQMPRQWDARSTPPQRVVRLAVPMSTADLLLRDVDGDGALDAVIGDSMGPWILYGPLWPVFDELQPQTLSVH